MNNPVPEHQPQVPASAGAQLRAYRESAQLTVDDVAHHLKLARRQVLAIENDELDALPGPTFVRGFIRNYARLLRVDPAPLLEAGGLAKASPGASIEHIAPTMGELPAEDASSGSWSRWLIPAGLVLVLAAGIAYYEFGGGARKFRKEPVEASAPVPAPANTDQPLVQPAAPAIDAAQPVPPPSAVSAPVPAAAPATTTPPAVSPPATTTPVAPSTPAAAVATLPTPATQAPAPADGGRVELAFTGTSWVEVRDAKGNLLLSRTLNASQPQDLTGTPPLTLTIGNARAARLSYNGAAIDLAPYTQREIARLTLPPRK
jgi:cytoskeleton protein RodZ